MFIYSVNSNGFNKIKRVLTILMLLACIAMVIRLGFYGQRVIMDGQPFKPPLKDNYDKNSIHDFLKRRELQKIKNPSEKDSIMTHKAIGEVEKYLLKDGSVDWNTVKRDKPFEFIIYRAIGNDLPPRHGVGQSYNNVKFILENEPKLEGLEKRWIINRIVNATEQLRIEDLLKQHKQTYHVITLDLKEYARLKNNYEGFGAPDILHDINYLNAAEYTQTFIRDAIVAEKNLYTMNNNGARNYMLRSGKEAGAIWILPFDGNCFITEKSWAALKEAVREKGNDTKYFYVPMERLTTGNEVLFDPNHVPNPREEPQIMFRFDSLEEFNENLRYGRRPKVEMLIRLNIDGPWQKWKPSSGPWENFNYYISSDIPENMKVPSASWVARLDSGHSTLDQPGTTRLRGLSRAKGINWLIDQLDTMAAEDVCSYSSEKLFFFDEAVLNKEKQLYKTRKRDYIDLIKIVDNLVLSADECLKHGPFSVTDKLQIPPFGDAHDYYSPAPYYWPNPKAVSENCPYIRIDGKRVPGTDLYDAFSEKFDRSRLNSMITNTTTLALAYHYTDKEEYIKKAADNIKTWFINENTLMRPHTRFSQVKIGRNGNVGSNNGIIEFKDFYFFLDAVRIANRANQFNAEEYDTLKAWFKEYYKFINLSFQGFHEKNTKNNHALYFDIQASAIATFINYSVDAKNILQESLPRLLHQINPGQRLFIDLEDRINKSSLFYPSLFQNLDQAGSLPNEINRAKPLHYILFTMQALCILASLAENHCVDLWNFRSSTDSEVFTPMNNASRFIQNFDTNPYSLKEVRDKSTGLDAFLTILRAVDHGHKEMPSITPGAFSVPKESRIKKVFIHNHPMFNTTWSSYISDDDEDMERFLPLFYDAIIRFPDLLQYLRDDESIARLGKFALGIYQVKPIFYAHDGIAPYWNLGKKGMLDHLPK